MRQRGFVGPSEVPVAPKACPFCNSSKVTTNSKAISILTYWRCTDCGQIWNADRLQHGQRMAPRRFV